MCTSSSVDHPPIATCSSQIFRALLDASLPIYFFTILFAHELHYMSTAYELTPIFIYYDVNGLVNENYYYVNTEPLPDIEDRHISDCAA